MQGKQEDFRSLTGTEESVLSVTIHHTAVGTWLITGDSSPQCPSLNLCLIWTPMSFSQLSRSKRGKSLDTCWNLAIGTVSRSAPHRVQTTLGNNNKKRISFRGLCGFLYPNVSCWLGLWEHVYFALSVSLSSWLLAPDENEIKNWVNRGGRKSQDKCSQKLQHLLNDNEAILSE